MSLLFGTAGIPHSSPERTTQGGIERIYELGLGCMEVEFVRGVKMSLDGALKVREAKEKRNIRLTAHAPYFINLNAKEKDKVLASKERIKDTARVSKIFGGEGVVFHPGFYMDEDPGVVYGKIKGILEEIVFELKEEDNFVTLRPEVMGRESQFGTLEEILRLSEEIEGVKPCIDFAHLHARTGGFNKKPEFIKVLEEVEKALGKEELKDLLIHISGIEYGAQGEKKHLNLLESDMNYRELLEALKEKEASGLIICESPNLEEDALLLKRTWESLF